MNEIKEIANKANISQVTYRILHFIKIDALFLPILADFQNQVLDQSCISMVSSAEVRRKQIVYVC